MNILDKKIQEFKNKENHKLFAFLIIVDYKTDEKIIENLLKNLYDIADIYVLINYKNQINEEVLFYLSNFNINNNFNVFIGKFLNFSQARNDLMNLIRKNIKYKYKYFFWIDSDETINIQNFMKLIEILKNLDDDIGGILIKRENIYNDNEKEIDFQLRLIRNDENIKFEGFCHEQIEQSIIDAKLRIDMFDLPIIIHNGYIDIIEQYKKLYRNIELLEQDKENPVSLYHLGKHYFKVARYNEALKIFQKSFELAIIRKSFILPIVIIDILRLLFSQKNFEGILEYTGKYLDLEIKESDIEIKNNVFVLYFRAIALMEVRQFEFALEYFKQAQIILLNRNGFVNYDGMIIDKNLINRYIGLISEENKKKIIFFDN